MSEPILTTASYNDYNRSWAIQIPGQEGRAIGLSPHALELGCGTLIWCICLNRI